MNTRRHEQDERELRDPALSALLKGAFKDDPALEESPGRTERIMRTVLASGIRPARRAFNWAPLGWAFSTAATAAAVVALVVMLANAPQPSGPIIANPGPVQPPVKNGQHNTPAIDQAPPRIVDRHINVQRELPGPNWRKPEQETTDTNQPARDETKIAAVQRPERIAAALFTTGSAAHAAGDYEAAYEAYQASYATVPTPDALLASSQALKEIADETLASDG